MSTKNLFPLSLGLDKLLDHIDQDLEEYGERKSSQPQIIERSPDVDGTMIPLHSNFSVMINLDQYKATLIYEPEKYDNVLPRKAKDIWDWLQEVGICYGIIEKNIQKAFSILKEKENASLEVIVAMGKPPVSGQDYRVLYWIADEKEKRDMDLLVEKDDLLLELELGSEGVSGITVFGQQVPPEIDLYPLPIGEENVRREGLRYYANVTGILKESGEVYRLVRVDRNATCEVHISDDRMKAYLQIHPAIGEGKPIKFDGVFRLFSYYKISAGIKQEVIQQCVQEALKNRKPISNVLVAEGKLPTRGKDGSILWHIDPNRNMLRYVIDESGKVDFFELNQVISVKAGDHLCSIIPPEKGLNGYTVLGEKLKGITGDACPIQVGENIDVRKGGTEWFAACAGQYLLEDNHLRVKPVYHISGDVDFSVGNIDFNGDVIVEGNILDGFKVRASGNLTVYGTIEAALVYAGENVEVKKGIFGKEKGEVAAEKDIISSFLQNANVQAGRDVIITDQSLNSIILARGNVEANYGKGSIIGGTTYAGREIIVKTLGTKYGTKTQVILGIDHQALQKMTDCRKRLTLFRKHLEKLEQVIEQMSNDENPDLIQENMDQVFQQACQKMEELQRTIHKLHINLEKLKESVVVTENPQLNAWLGIMPGVSVKMHEACHFFHEPSKRCLLKYDVEGEKVVIVQ